MHILSARAASVGLVTLLSATSAWADLTADDVWSQWKSFLEGSGYEIDGSESRSGDTLTVSNFEMSMPIPDATGAFTVTIGAIAFREQGDGTVAVDLPNTMPLRAYGSEGDEKFDAAMSLSQTGQTMVVSGTPQDMLYTYSAASMGLALDEMTVDGAQVPPEIARVALTTGAMTSTTRMVVGDQRAYEQQMTMDGVSYDFAFTDPESTDRASVTGQLAKVRFSGEGVVPLELDPEDMAKMLKEGFAFSGSFDYENGSSNIEGSDGSDTFSYQSTSDSGQFGVSMDASQLGYDLASSGAEATAVVSQFPFPVSIEMAKAGMNLAMPIGQGDQEQDFAFGLNLTEFEMADTIWGLLDPGGILPRDPATIAMDLTGKAKVLADIFAPDFPDNLEGPPGELNAVSLNSMIVSMVGAQLTGSGAFTFDNTDMSTFDGIPRPAGTVELQLSGANALLDRLVQMGMVGDQEVMGARMMMGMLAVPGAEPDSLNSRIEINDEGHILANGQRIR